MAKNKKVNGFQCFMNHIKASDPQVKAKCKSMPMMVNYCDPLWRALSDAEKQKYNDEAKSINSRSKANVPFGELMASIETTESSTLAPRNIGKIKSSPTKCPPKSIHDLVQEYISNSKRILMEQQVSRWKTLPFNSWVEHEDFLFVDIQCSDQIGCPSQFRDHEHYTKVVTNKMLKAPSAHSDFMTLTKINCIPAEITIVEYNLTSGLKACYHDYLSIADFVPLGYMSSLKYATEHTHRIPSTGVDSSDIRDVIAYVTYILAKSQSNVLYCKKSQWKNVSQSINWIVHTVNTGTFGGVSGTSFIPMVTDFEDLTKQLQCHVTQHTGIDPVDLSSQMRNMLYQLNTTRYDFMSEIQHAMSEVFAKNLNISMTDAHFPTATLALNTPFRNIPVMKVLVSNSQEKKSKQPASKLPVPLSKTVVPDIESVDRYDRNSSNSITNFDLYRY